MNPPLPLVLIAPPLPLPLPPKPFPSSDLAAVAQLAADAMAIARAERVAKLDVLRAVETCCMESLNCNGITRMSEADPESYARGRKPTVRESYRTLPEFS
jgi:hypothetical protein